MSEIVLATKFEGIPLFKRGKVRDIYYLNDKLLLVATDRISAFDCVMPNGIPNKGRVLNLLSAYWFSRTQHILGNHMVTINMTRLCEIDNKLTPYFQLLSGRAMLVEKAESIPVECVVRGYLAGSAWREYQASGKVCGINLPEDMVESQRLPASIFTPATKAESGHDENITIEQMTDIVDKWWQVRRKGSFGWSEGRILAKTIIDKSQLLYSTAFVHALERGIVIADTKFEFGINNTGHLVVIDEMLTPDSSRFWPLDDYEPGRSQRSFDKQYVRDYLESIGWNKEPPVPELPKEVVANTSAKYLEAYQRIVGMSLAE